MPRPKPFRRPDGFRTPPRTVFERTSCQPADRTVFEPSARTDSGLSSGPISGTFPKEFQTAIRRDSAPPSGQIPDRFPEEFQAVIPDRFQVPGRIPDRHPYEPQLGRIAAPEIAPQSGRHSRRRNVRPQPPYPNKRFSSAANLYPAFSTCASANSCEKMMKSRDSSYESV